MKLRHLAALHTPLFANNGIHFILMRVTHSRLCFYFIAEKFNETYRRWVERHTDMPQYIKRDREKKTEILVTIKM